MDRQLLSPVQLRLHAPGPHVTLEAQEPLPVQFAVHESAGPQSTLEAHAPSELQSSVQRPVPHESAPAHDPAWQSMVQSSAAEQSSVPGHAVAPESSSPHWIMHCVPPQRTSDWQALSPIH
jgi:hypothetical protein